LADDVFILDTGEIMDQGTVDQVYEEPSSLRALQMLGFPGANTMPGELTGDVCRSPFGDFSVDLMAAAKPGPIREVTVGFRPEAVVFGSAATRPRLSLGAQELLREDLGAETILYFEAAGGRYVGFWSNGLAAPQLEKDFRAALDPRDLLIFETETGRRIGRGKDLNV
jgi:multiple sugar transport system ATP-binding protein